MLHFDLCAGKYSRDSMIGVFGVVESPMPVSEDTTSEPSVWKG